MLTQPERQAVLLLAGVIVLLLAFYLGTAVLLPEGGAIAYSDNVSDGALVTHSGVVQDLTITKTGGHLIVNVSGVAVFVPGGGSKLTLFIGDTVTLRGTVSTYAGKKEIIVNYPSDIVVV